MNSSQDVDDPFEWRLLIRKRLYVQIRRFPTYPQQRTKLVRHPSLAAMPSGRMDVEYFWLCLPNLLNSEKCWAMVNISPHG